EEPDTGSLDTSACQTLSGGRIEQAANGAGDGSGVDGASGDGDPVGAAAPSDDGRPVASAPAVPTGLPEHPDASSTTASPHATLSRIPVMLRSAPALASRQ